MMNILAVIAGHFVRKFPFISEVTSVIPDACFSFKPFREC